MAHETMLEDQREPRWAILLELSLVIAIFFVVRALANELDLRAAGSLGVLSSVATATMLMSVRGRSWRDFGLTMPMGMKGWGFTVLMGIVVMLATGAIVMFVVMPISMRLLGGPGPDVSGHFLWLKESLPVFLVYLFGVVWISAAIGEELFVRGWMMNKVAVLFGYGFLGWTLALFGQAFFFGFAHSYQGMLGMIATGSIGFIFGVFYLINQRRLIPLIIAHGLIDTISLTQLYLS